jgi:hypothetical protein
MRAVLSPRKRIWMKPHGVLLATLLAAPWLPVHGAAQPASVLTYHGHADRSGTSSRG